MSNLQTAVFLSSNSSIDHALLQTCMTLWGVNGKWAQSDQYLCKLFNVCHLKHFSLYLLSTPLPVVYKPMDFRPKTPAKGHFTWTLLCTMQCTMWFIALHSGLPQRTSPRLLSCPRQTPHFGCEQHQLSGQTSATNKDIEYWQGTKCLRRPESGRIYGQDEQHFLKTATNLASSQDNLIKISRINAFELHANMTSWYHTKLTAYIWLFTQLRWTSGVEFTASDPSPVCPCSRFSTSPKQARLTTPDAADGTRFQR